ncbi:MAG: hypothetical protein ACO2OS_07330 [Thermosphaera aggregans]
MEGPLVEHVETVQRLPQEIERGKSAEAPMAEPGERRGFLQWWPRGVQAE